MCFAIERYRETRSEFLSRVGWKSLSLSAFFARHRSLSTIDEYCRRMFLKLVNFPFKAPFDILCCKDCFAISLVFPMNKFVKLKIFFLQKFTVLPSEKEKHFYRKIMLIKSKHKQTNCWCKVFCCFSNLFFLYSQLAQKCRNVHAKLLQLEFALNGTEKRDSVEHNMTISSHFDKLENANIYCLTFEIFPHELFPAWAQLKKLRVSCQKSFWKSKLKMINFPRNKF